MNTKIRRVLIGFLELSSDEREEFVRMLQENNDISKQFLLKERLKREERQDSGLGVDLGPLGNAPCPCCGK